MTEPQNQNNSELTSEQSVEVQPLTEQLQVTEQQAQLGQETLAMTADNVTKPAGRSGKWREIFCPFANMPKLFWLNASAFLLAAFLMYGVVGSSRELQTVIEEAMRTLVSSVVGDNGTITAVAIFKNNLRATILFVILGIIPFLFLPLWSIVSNGLLIGGMVAYSTSTGALSLWRLLVCGLLPHGIFELTACFIAASLGSNLCLYLGRRLRHKTELLLSEVLRRIAAAYVCVVVPLLLVAAVIEVYVTPLLLML